MTIFQKAQNNTRSLAQIAEKMRWVVIAVVSALLVWAEVVEFIQLSFLNQPFHIFELVIYTVLIVATGLFVELFVRTNHDHKRLARILEFKHDLSLNLILSDDWNTLTAKLVGLPARIADVEDAYLLMNNPVSGQFDIAGQWVRENGTQALEPWEPRTPCQDCILKSKGQIESLHPCSREGRHHFNRYCLGITNNNLPATILKFRLTQGSRLSRDEMDIFSNISDEIATAILAIQDRRRLNELQSAQVALAERRLVSAYVHDWLAQNLGYLHLKLDQLGRDETVMGSASLRAEIDKLCEVADDSYDTVRDILKKLQPETIPHLTNLLKEHAVRVSREVRLKLHFESRGAQSQLPAQAQQSVFNAYHEILGNVQKHAQASQVNILVDWKDDTLEITVADNGVGFDKNDTQKEGHFGLEFVQDRITALRGQLKTESSVNSGTVVSISVPITR